MRRAFAMRSYQRLALRIVKPLALRCQLPYLFRRSNEVGAIKLGGAFVALPAFNEDGDLPPGVYRATMTEVLERFGQGSIQRRAVADRLKRIYELVASTRQLTRSIVFGSFVTAKAEPNDADIVLLMEDAFDLASLTDETALVFQHLRITIDTPGTLEDRLDAVCLASTKSNADPSVSLDDVRKVLAKMAGTLTQAVIAEREER